MKYLFLTLLLVFPPFVFSDDDEENEDNGLEGRVSILEDQFQDLQDAPDELLNWYVYPSGHKAAYNSNEEYVGPMVRDHPSSDQSYIAYTLNGEDGYIRVKNSLIQVRQLISSYSDCSDAYVVLSDSDFFYSLPGKDNYIGGNWFVYGDQTIYYVNKIDPEPFIILGPVYRFYSDWDCREYSQYEGAEVYFVLDSEEWGPSSYVTYEYVEELPDE